MAISQATQNFVFSVVDANQEYNTKLIIFCLGLIYLISILVWRHNIIPFRTSREDSSKFPLYQQIAVKVMTVFTVPLLFFYPLIVGIMTYREYALDKILTLMLTGYGVITIIAMGLWFIFGIHWTLDLLKLGGIDVKDTKGTIIRRRE